MCIPVDALLGGLVRRIEDEQYRASEQDVRALLQAGCPADRIAHALAREGEAFAHARALLSRLVGASS